jgi:hypothetical protein
VGNRVGKTQVVANTSAPSAPRYHGQAGGLCACEEVVSENIWVKKSLLTFINLCVCRNFRPFDGLSPAGQQDQNHKCMFTRGRSNRRNSMLR